MKHKNYFLTMSMAATAIICSWLYVERFRYRLFKYERIYRKTTETSTVESIDLNSLELPQLNTEVADNEDLIEMVTTKGTIKIKLFPELAPKAVENFMTHAKDGYYDGVTFHRVIQDFYDPRWRSWKGNGTGGRKYLGRRFRNGDLKPTV